MNKLIDLINVYRKEKYPKSKLRYYKYDSLNHEFLSNCIPNDSEEKVLGRRFGFIQRLVKENKIDFQKFREKAKFLILSNSIKNYEILIIELSIQKKPVQFLIDILA